MSIDIAGTLMLAAAAVSHCSLYARRAVAKRRHRHDLQIAYRLGLARGRDEYRQNGIPPVRVDVDVSYDPTLPAERRRQREELLLVAEFDRGAYTGWLDEARHDLDADLTRMGTTR